MNKPKELNMEPLAVSVPYAAVNLLGVSTTKGYQLAKMPGFPVVKVGGRMLVSVKGLERWLETVTTTSGTGVNL